MCSRRLRDVQFAGADFIKTSTGKEEVNAILPVGLVMVRAIREYYQRTGHKVRRFTCVGVTCLSDEAAAWSLSQLIVMYCDRRSSLRLGASFLCG